MSKKIYYLLITFVFSLIFFVRCTDDYTTFDESNKDHNHTNEKLNNLLNYLNLNSEEDLKEHLSDFISNDFKLNIDFHKITETKNKDGILDKVALYAEDLDSSNNVFYNIVFVKKNDEIITYLVSFTLDKNSETRRFVTKVEKSNNKRQSRCGGNEFYYIEVFSCPSGHTDSGCPDCRGCWRLVGQGFTNPEECDNPFPFAGSGGDGGGSNGGYPNYSPEYLRLNNMIFEMNVKFGYKLTQPQWDNFHNYPAILTKFHSSVMNSEYSNATYLWAIAFLYDNVSAANYFNQNPQDLIALLNFQKYGDEFLNIWINDFLTNVNEYSLNNEFYNFQFDYRSQMSQQELNIFNSLSPQSQFKYLKNAYFALNKAQDLYANSIHNGKGDAFRHAYFNALNVISIGKFYTEQLSTAHENKPPEYSYSFKENNMDLFNNKIGRDYGELILLGNSTSVENLIKSALQRGELRYLTPLGDNRCPTCANQYSQLTPTNL